MKPTEHDRVEHLVNQAMELKPAERPVFLLGACGQDADLRQQVETLLHAAEEAEGFMEGVTTFDDTQLIEGPGTVVGRYKLLHKVGEGGMGAVYMAEQTEPVTRKVALKIIKLGMDTKQVVARFEAERQALAMMDHPHIAKVHDAGATDTGRPYFVMELVRGLPITEYCDKNKLSTQQRLELFIPVCQAIQHAHQQGIIHRDIKPSNVMVTLNDGSAHPMVIDFGIAKATHQKLTEKTLFTNYSQMIGTPAYMSPEQAEMSKLDVDTRTDVYSLGVLLYELLTGTTPFPTKALMSLGYGEMQRIIAEKEPPKPSTRMSTMEGEQRKSIAKNRSMDVSALGRLFKGDLDWIVMKALEKDRSHRYETVNALVADVRRHLANEPVSAAAPNFSYQWQKFYRRNRKPIHVGLAIMMGLVCLGGFAVMQVIKVQKQRVEVQLQKRSSNEIAEFALDFFTEVTPGLVGNAELREVIKNTEKLLDSGLTNSSIAELKIRHKLLELTRELNSYENAAIRAEQLESLLSSIPAVQFDGEDRFAMELDIVVAKLWGAELTTESSKSAIGEMHQLTQRWGRNKEFGVNAAAQCYMKLADFYFLSYQFPECEQALIESLPYVAKAIHSSVNPHLLGLYWMMRLFGFDPVGLEEVLPEVIPLNAGSGTEYHIDYRLYINRRMRYLTETKFDFDLARKELGEYRDQVEAIDMDDALNERLRRSITGWENRLDLYDGDFKESMEFAVSILNNDAKFTDGDWASACDVALRARSFELYDKLRLIGFTRFAGLDDDGASSGFTRMILLRPLSDEMQQMVREVIKRWKVQAEQYEHYSNYPEVIAYSEAMLEYRSGNFGVALEKLESYLGFRSNRPLMRFAQNLFKMNWAILALKSMILAQQGERELSIKAYEEAKALRPNRKGLYSRRDGWTNDLWFREAEELLIEKGWLDPEDAMAAFPRSVGRE